MTRRDRPSRHWAALVPDGPVSELAAHARALESAGLAGIFCPQIYGPPFVPLAACAAVTERIALASGIAIAFARSPFETAMAAMDLDRLSGGRFTLGLGTSVETWSGGFFGARSGRPLSRLREVIAIVRRVVATSHLGALGRIEGEYHRHDFTGFQPLMAPVRSEIPIWIAALRAPLVGLAAEIADGLIGHPIWSVEWALERAGRQLPAALAAAGRPRERFHVTTWFFVAIGADRRQAVEDARATVAFYAGVAEYEPYFTAHGFGREARLCQAGVQAGDYRSVAGCVPDEMVETFVICGTPDDVRRRLAPVWEAVDAMCLVPPYHGSAPEVVGAYAGRIAEAFYG